MVQIITEANRRERNPKATARNRTYGFVST
jgi:hypothetical protein